MNKIFAAKYLMIVAILTIATFQGYWLYKLYAEEYNNIQRKADVILKQTILSLQESTIKTDSNFIQLLSKNNALSKFEVVYDSVKQSLTAKPSKKIKENTTSVLDTNINVTYITQQSSSYRANDNADSILKTINPNSIRSIVIRKDSSDKRRGSIIIHSSLDNLNDSSSKAFRNALLKDSSRLKKISTAIKITGKSAQYHSNENFKAISKEKNPLPFKDRINISNLVLKIFTDSISPQKLDSVFKLALSKEKVSLPFKIVAKRVLKEGTNIIDTAKPSLHTNVTTIGLVKPMAYQAIFGNPLWFILKRLSLPISISLILLSFVTLAFVFLYRNMMAQSKLADLKSDFISNVSHELKTPIATVSVAIEALRKFHAIDDKKKAQDYLDISSLEINRLSLLVENVLKLSMFENDKIELQKEQFDIVALTKNVVNALGIQIDNKQAAVDMIATPDFIFINADKLQITSIFFNLLDNALKYCTANPKISITLLKINDSIRIVVKDNGIGISKVNQKKIFEKFFRVQSGDKHNVKGYGLGLSYVNHIVNKHKGTITVVSELDKGSEFVIDLLA